MVKKNNKNKISHKKTKIVKKNVRKHSNKTVKRLKKKVIIKKKAVKTKNNIRISNDKIDILLEVVITKVKASDEFHKIIKLQADEIISKINQSIKEEGISATVFIGGSLAKGTLLKKDVNDVDLFIRFDDEEIERYL